MAKILIVDDDPDIVEASSLFLQKAGHTVTGAYSRREGMDAIAASAPDLLILDVMMEQPDDGFAMAQDLRRQGRNFPILMLTSVASASGLAFGKDPEMVPVDDFQAKPVEPAELVRKVANLLKRREV
ncbi:MAG: response regulator [Holophaga sp.]|jgi:DNA-binding response OmpR family regulator